MIEFEFLNNQCKLSVFKICMHFLVQLMFRNLISMILRICEFFRRYYPPIMRKQKPGLRKSKLKCW